MTLIPPLVMIADEHYYFSLCQYVFFLEIYYDLVCVHERDTLTSRRDPSGLMADVKQENNVYEGK
jgi:hypothetical protein